MGSGAHENTYALETRHASQLTDKQLLAILTQRAGEITALMKLASLVKVLEHAADLNPAHALGMRAAIGLTKIFGQMIQPGHEAHPFKEFQGTIQSCFTLIGAMPATRAAKKEKPYPLPVRASVPRDVFGVPKVAVKKRHAKTGTGKVGDVIRLMNDFEKPFREYHLLAAAAPHISVVDVSNAIQHAYKRKEIWRLEAGLYTTLPPDGGMPFGGQGN